MAGFAALADDWQMVRTSPDLARDAAQLPDLPWIAAPVPGTAASALRAAGAWSDTSPPDLHGGDIWYRARIVQDGRHILRFSGLAGLADIWLDGCKLLETDNMFRVYEVGADLRPGQMLHLRFRSLAKALQGQRGRPRWRPRMIQPPSLRAIRTTPLGHMPGWCPPIHAVGPWRAIEALPLDGPPQPRAWRLRTSLDPDGTGHLNVSVALSAPCDAASVSVGGGEHALRIDGDRWQADIAVPDAPLWWPHTHGRPELTPVALHLGDTRIPLGTCGFRRVHVDRGADGESFDLHINGCRVFCRGASWLPADLAALSERDGITERLTLARDAGMNMLRLPGVGVIESAHFYAECDRLGIMVWQDCMFANFDYPQDDLFLASATAEVSGMLERLAAHPCLAVLCGGSEIAQQAAMLGVPAEARAHPLFDAIIPDLAHKALPGLPFVPHSPGGGALPFQTRTGIAHYYGVGAYQRPIEDTRRAGVRFASECLAFANVPDDITIDRHIRVRHTADARWKAGVPRDAGAGWDFEDVRDHYLRALFGRDPARLRYEDPDRYLDLSRATVAAVMEAVFAEWRRPGSGCGGALVWFLADLRPGAGWGVIDSTGRPKSAYHALRRACRPMQLAITDEGLNGLDLHVINDTAHPVHANLRLDCLAGGQVRQAGAAQPISVPPRGAITINSAALLPHFFDITYAYRFGPPVHDVTIASLHDAADNSCLGQACHFPRGLGWPRAELGLQIALDRDPHGWFLRLRTDRFAQFVHLADRLFQAEDDWFHLPPDTPRILRLRGPDDAVPSGEVAALNSLSSLRYGEA